MTTLDRKFLKEWDAAIKKIGEASDKTVQAASLELFGNIVKRTPVGNPTLWKNDAPAGYTGGTLRGNWQTTIGRPAGSILNDKDKSGSKVSAKASAVTSRFSINGTQSLFFTNNLPYAYRVEYGRWSQQAPSGMVRVSVTSFSMALETAARQNRI